MYCGGISVIEVEIIGILVFPGLNIINCLQFRLNCLCLRHHELSLVNNYESLDYTVYDYELQS